MSVPVRELEGRPHYVVPTVMITTGVHAGSQGPVLYEANALTRSVPFWNGKPVVVYHPDMHGRSPAGSPAIFNRQKVGTLFNTSFDGRRLCAEVWIDAGRVNAVDPRVLDAIRNGHVMEVSTGLHVEHSGRVVPVGGLSALVAEQLHPDHLALLPDQRGACSVADGAGLFVNSQLTQVYSELSKPLAL